MSESFVGSVSIEGNMGVIKFDLDQIHGMRVMIQPVRQGATVSNSTQRLRDQFDKALAQLQRRAGK